MKKSFLKKSLFSFLVAALVCSYGADAFSFGSTSAPPPPPFQTLSCNPYEGTPNPPDGAVKFGAYIANSQAAIFDYMCESVTTTISQAFVVLQNQKQEIDALEAMYWNHVQEINALEAKQDDACELTEDLDICDSTVAAIREELDCPHVATVCIGAADASDADDLAAKPAKKFLTWKK